MIGITQESRAELLGVRAVTQEMKDSSKIVVEQQSKKAQSKALATLALTPSSQSARTIRDYSHSFGDLNLICLVEELRDQIEDAVDGNLTRAEAILITQAHTLDAIFNCLARKAIRAEYISSIDAYLKLGLRAQSQCRATLEALAAMKKPPVELITQTNIAHGHQQVNNHLPDGQCAENRSSQSKQLEKTHGERLDFGKAETAVRSDHELDAVGKQHRATND